MFVKNSIVCAYDDAQQRQNMNVTSAIKVSECLVFCTIPIQRLSAYIHVAVFREIHSVYSLNMRVCHPEVRGICWSCMNEASSLLNPYQCWKDSMRLLHRLPCNSEADRLVPGSTLFLSLAFIDGTGSFRKGAHCAHAKGAIRKLVGICHGVILVVTQNGKCLSFSDHCVNDMEGLAPTR